jgi:branched-chain amino acid transport system ATP-binding protein
VSVSAERRNAVSVRNIKVQYANGAYGVVDVSLSVESGQMVALLGPNGAGKTTTAGAIAGFTHDEGARVVSGSVTLFGRDITNSEPRKTTRAGVGLVPERRKVFPNLTVAENLRAVGGHTPRRRRRARTEDVLAMFPILKEKLKVPAGRLSGGQQQMLAIARCLVVGPDVLILDEMTLGLHASLHAPLFATLRQIAEEGTAVLVIDEISESTTTSSDHYYYLADGHMGSLPVRTGFTSRPPTPDQTRPGSVEALFDDR